MIIYLYTIPGIVVLVLCGQLQVKAPDCVLLFMFDALQTIQEIESYISILAEKSITREEERSL